MSENLSIGMLFKEALREFSEKHKDDKSVCGVKIDLRSQGIDLIVGIRFIDGECRYSVCTAGTNCESADDSDFELLSDALKNIGVESKTGAVIMIKRNAQVVSTAEGCSAIESIQKTESASEETPKKRGGLFGLFGQK